MPLASPPSPDWAFRSDPADVADVWGFVPISDTVEITKCPLMDVKNDLFARLGGGPAAAFLASKGWRLPTVEEYDALRALALHVEPYVLPEPHMVLEAGVALHDQDAIERFRVTHMMTKEWCSMHDLEAMTRACLAGFDGSQAVDNLGKHWAQPDAAHPARAGHSLIYGWWTPRARAYGVSNDVQIQPPSDFHDLAYDDYGTTFHAARART